jgi:hypothetical protein
VRVRQVDPAGTRLSGLTVNSSGLFYNALGAVWVPLATEIVRIDPARLPG